MLSQIFAVKCKNCYKIIAYWAKSMSQILVNICSASKSKSTLIRLEGCHFDSRAFSMSAVVSRWVSRVLGFLFERCHYG